MLGCIADDFTGATDLGNTLAREGLTVSQLVGVPGQDQRLPAVDAEIVALKTRTAPREVAVEASLEALAWLRTRGVERVMFKYCSTFDSRPEGNIGPVADRLLDAVGGRSTVICPAFPETGRTVYRGQLFVGGERLDESPMAHHPLTPMRDASVIRLLQAQTSRKVALIDYDTVRQGATAIRRAMDHLSDAGTCYVVVDALEDRHLRDIATAVADLPLVTGASGIARGLPDAYRMAGILAPRTDGSSSSGWQPGPSAILAGSASPSTREQIRAIVDTARVIAFDPIDAADAPERIDQVLDTLVATLPGIPLLHPESSPANVRRVQRALGRDRAAEIIEGVFAAAATRLVAAGVRRLIVAGGETSAAVVRALDVRCLLIGPEIAPGVPWCTTVGEPTLALALKSGNFGSRTFFRDALSMVP